MSLRPLTGRTVFFIFLSGFGIITTANLLLAFSAVRSFPGLEVANTYVASQSFQERRAAQRALGWTMRADYREGRLFVELRDRDGGAAPAEGPEITVGRLTSAQSDRTLRLDAAGSVALDLGPGLWRVDLRATGPGGVLFEKRAKLQVVP